MAQINPSLSYSFQGKRVLVTGGAAGIGLVIVNKFYHDGAQVFVLDKDAQLLNQLKLQLPSITTICVDMSDWAATRQAVEALAPLHHLVNNAGICSVGALQDVSPVTFDAMFAVNVKGMLNVSQAFVKGVVNGGTIVNIGSITGSVASPFCGIYSATKAAVTMLTKSMALEFAQLDNHIRVNCICPGMVPGTNLAQGLSPELVQKAIAMMEIRNILKHRAIQPADVAHAVLFLSSPLSEMITGQTLIIDAGFCAT